MSAESATTLPAPTRSPVAGSSRELELRDVLDIPFPTDLIAASTHDRIAWVFNEGGCRNVWIARIGSGGPAEAARRLTRYRGDDGLTIGHLCWNQAGDAVVYVRGTVLSDDRPPNPASAPDAQTGPEVWIASVHGVASSRRLGAGHSPAISPMHGDIAWIHDGQVWHTNERTRDEPTPLFRDRGRCSELRWSPDGTRLAFVSERDDHSLLGVYAKATRTIRWMSPSVHRDRSPTWSPDGCRVAFIRVADGDVETYTARREGLPWSVWVADAGTGAGHCRWRAAHGAGSVFRPLAAGVQLIWNAKHGIVFPWEGSGWLHLNVLANGVADQTDPVDLTPGAFEIASMTAEGAADALVCAANKHEVDGCRLWRLDLDTRGFAPLTSQRSLAWGPVVTRGGIVTLLADARTPLQPVWLDASSTSRALAADAFSADFPYPRLVDPQPVAFHSPDGHEIHAQLFVPAQCDDRTRRPAIVHFHGGPTRQMFAAWHPTECYHLQYGLNQYLATRGYVVLSVNYRGGTGYGLDFREALELGPSGGSEYQDAIGAAIFLSDRADVDAKRIGAYGVSYGGLLTALALARASDRFAAGVDCAGIADWRPAFPGSSRKVLRAAGASSPLASVDRWTSPVLFIHADDDREVPFSQTIEIVRHLERRSDVDVECIVLPDEQHDFLLRASWARMFEATADFFHRKIGPSSCDSPIATSGTPP